MAQYDDLAVTMNGIVKKVYGRGVHLSVPDNISMFFKDFPFVPNQERLGDTFVEAICLSIEQGLTRATDNAGVFSLNNSIASTVQQAFVHGGVIVNQAAMSWDLAAKARSANSAQSFENSMTLIIDNLILGHRRAQVMDLLYGGTNIGVIASTASSATQTLTNISCAAGIFYGSQGALFDIYDPTLTTKRNGSPLSLVSFSVDPTATTRTLTFGASVSTTANDVLVPTGVVASSAVTTPLGLSAIASTQASTLYGLNQATYPMFQSAVYDAGSAPLTMAKLDKASQMPLIRGVTGKMKLYTSPMAFSDLAQEEVGRIHLTQGLVKGDVTVGYTGLNIACSSGSTIEVVGSPWIKEGESYLIPNDSSLRRIGAVDVQLGAPGDNYGAYWRRIEGQSGFSIVSYSLQALFTPEPWKITRIQNIVSN